MKKFLMGAVGLIALGMAPASAADMAVKARPAPARDPPTVEFPKADLHN